MQRKAAPKTTRSRNASAGGSLDIKKIFGPIRKERLALRALNQPQPIAGAATRREARSLAKRAGLDPDALEELGSRQHAQVLRLAEKRRAQAIARSESAQRVLGGAAVAWADGLQAVATTGAATRDLLDTPFLIWPTLGLTLDQSTMAPVNSVVKLHYQATSGYGFEEVSFFFDSRTRALTARRSPSMPTSSSTARLRRSATEVGT